MGKFREKIMHIIILGINFLSILLCCCVENNEGSKDSFVFVETNNGINVVFFSVMIAILAFIYLVPVMKKANFKTKKLLGGLAYLILGVFIFSNCMAASNSNVIIIYPIAIFNVFVVISGIVLLCFKIPKPVALEIDNRPVTIKEHLTDESEGGVLLNNIPKTIVKKPEKLSESSNELLYWMKLYDDGLITEEEFKKIKEKLYKIAGI